MYTIPQALRSLDLLKDLPDQDLEHLSRFSLLRQIRTGETVFRQSEPSPYCFGIVSGKSPSRKRPPTRRWRQKF